MTSREQLRMALEEAREEARVSGCELLRALDSYSVVPAQQRKPEHDVLIRRAKGRWVQCRRAFKEAWDSFVELGNP